MIVVRHKAEGMDIYQQFSLFPFHLTTCDVVRLVEAVKGGVDPIFIVKFKKIVDKSKMILFIYEDLSFIHAAI